MQTDAVNECNECLPCKGSFWPKYVCEVENVNLDVTLPSKLVTYRVNES